MSSPRLERAKKYQDAIRRILLQEWDPIGVKDEPLAQGEYDSYIGQIYGRLIRHESREQLFEYLWLVETDSMGLYANRSRTDHVVELLLEFRDQMEAGGWD